MKQRFGIAQQLNNPKLIIIDVNQTVGLDLQNVTDFLNVLREIRPIIPLFFRHTLYT
jgi:ABC-type multidrug transport system ATPase subunit